MSDPNGQDAKRQKLIEDAEHAHPETKLIEDVDRAHPSERLEAPKDDKEESVDT